ncbi:MAG: site-specific DNA-methyltransferase [Selenomonadaceae bacterium]|nr:site-specific DNA-methyltransferase [Selenomonadaceae bacterium]
MIKQGDCLELMKEIPGGSVDMILTDLPYGITDCAFDVRIPFEPMWEQFKRVTKRNAAIVLFSQMPFGAELIMSNRKMFRYEWIWEKSLGVGFFNSKKMPLRCHENILVFYQALPTYNPQFTKGKAFKKTIPSGLPHNHLYSTEADKHYEQDGEHYYPRDVQKFNPVQGHESPRWHPTQKPQKLLEYLIKTYTNAGELVLDATMGSGSTGVACVNTGRKFIGFEKEQNFFEIAEKRIDEAASARAQELF